MNANTPIQIKYADNGPAHRAVEAAMNANAATQTKLEKMLRLPQVEVLSGLKKTSIYNGAHDGTFPKPIRISARCVAWRESDLLAWQAQREQAPIGAKKKAAE